MKRELGLIVIMGKHLFLAQNYKSLGAGRYISIGGSQHQSVKVNTVCNCSSTEVAAIPLNGRRLVAGRIYYGFNVLQEFSAKVINFNPNVKVGKRLVMGKLKEGLLRERVWIIH